MMMPIILFYFIYYQLFMLIGYYYLGIFEARISVHH